MPRPPKPPSPESMAAAFKQKDAEEPKLTVAWKPFEGKQSFAMSRPDDEILYGGARGGGKTSCLTAWMAIPAVAKDDNGKVKYPTYTGVILRYLYNDLRKFNEDAWKLYKQFGAVRRDDPIEFHFPGGPIIYTGHLNSRESWERYQGWNIHRLGVEEVAQIPQESIYQNTRASVRGSPTGLSQTFATANPGNAGDPWVKKRFIKVLDIKGNLIKPCTPIKDARSNETRIYIPATVYDNHWILENDPQYIERLKAYPENVRRAWLEGDWDAFEGSFFPSFRPLGPFHGEPLHARHVLPHSLTPMPPWWLRWASVDWGYSHYSAGFKFCADPRGQVHVYNELSRQKTNSFRLGTDIAHWLLPELEMAADGKVLLYMSPDAIDQTRDEGHNIADQVQLGIEAALGKGSAWVLRMTPEEKATYNADPGFALELMARRQEEEVGKRSIIIVRANNNRVAGWNFMRDLLEFRDLPRPKPDQAYVEALLKEHHSDEKITRYLAMFEPERERMLPGMVIHDDCPRLIDWIPSAIHNPNRPEDIVKADGDDWGDSVRYGLMAYADNQQAMPTAVRMAERLRQAQDSLIARGFDVQDPFLMRMERQKIDADLSRERDAMTAPISFSRGGVRPSLTPKRFM